MDDPYHRIPKEWSFAKESSKGCQSEGPSIKELDLKRGVVSALLLGAVLEVLTLKRGLARRGMSLPRLMRDAHWRANVVPLNCNLGLLLADNEARV